MRVLEPKNKSETVREGKKHSRKQGKKEVLEENYAPYKKSSKIKKQGRLRVDKINLPPHL